MTAFKTSLLRHAISFDEVVGSLAKMETAVAENNDKLDRMLAVRPQLILLILSHARPLRL